MLDSPERSAQEARAQAVALGLVDPTADGRGTKRMVAPRLATLAGKSAGLLDNRKGNGDRLLDRIGVLLQERYGVANLEETKKFTYSRRAEADELDDLASRCDFVVTAIGD